MCELGIVIEAQACSTPLPAADMAGLQVCAAQSEVLDRLDIGPRGAAATETFPSGAMHGSHWGTHERRENLLGLPP